MSPEELLAEWESGESGLRPARVQVLRDDLTDAGLDVPRRVPAIEEWLQAVDVREVFETAATDD